MKKVQRDIFVTQVREKTLRNAGDEKRLQTDPTSKKKID